MSDEKMMPMSNFQRGPNWDKAREIVKEHREYLEGESGLGREATIHHAYEGLIARIAALAHPPQARDEVQRLAAHLVRLANQDYDSGYTAESYAKYALDPTFQPEPATTDYPVAENAALAALPPVAMPADAVEKSTGCVFCDLALTPKAIDGRMIHAVRLGSREQRVKMQHIKCTAALPPVDPAGDGTRFADCLFAYQSGRDRFEGKLSEVWGDQWDGIHGDSYDNSIELHKVSNDARLDEVSLRVIFNAGFTKVYLNHHDGAETHYHWDTAAKWFKESRAKYPHKAATLPAGDEEGPSAECARTRTDIGGVRFPGHASRVAKDGKSEPNAGKPFDTARATLPAGDVPTDAVERENAAWNNFDPSTAQIPSSGCLDHKGIFIAGYRAGTALPLRAAAVPEGVAADEAISRAWDQANRDETEDSWNIAFRHALQTAGYIIVSAAPARGPQED